MSTEFTVYRYYTNNKKVQLAYIEIELWITKQPLKFLIYGVKIAGFTRKITLREKNVRQMLIDVELVEQIIDSNFPQISVNIFKYIYKKKCVYAYLIQFA